MRGSRRKAGVLALAVVASYRLVVRGRQLGWGSTEDEARGRQPGDELLDRPDLVATRAITIDAPVEGVWPWIAQLGQGRGGFYSYDLAENLAGCDIHSADRILPQWQDIAVGDEIRLAPQVGLRVAAVAAGRALVLRGAIPMGALTPPYDFTWAFVLAPGPGGGTRLIVRERYAYTRWWAPLLIEPVSAVAFVMTRKMLRGIKQRAEQEPRRSTRERVGASG
ncbi:SRPBCC family protein [Nonomuraea basaltis]|uniref:SRPBCC family protein n=1 Tax=Nonomuraea basaltis TaxID=2495887 RepID=UPI00110C448C|nr:SRPBCC family protein [Nonomuraea basaltis]TMR88974.1 SRPBCC family protein [Nonomuraea basaltis]